MLVWLPPARMLLLRLPLSVPVPAAFESVTPVVWVTGAAFPPAS